MNTMYLAYRQLVFKPLNLLLSLVLLVLSVALVTFAVELSKQVNGQMTKNIAPVDMVVGAKGSPLQLVLSSVLHIDVPTGNIKQKETEFIKNHPFVGSAIPVSYGDNYKGYRILGTERHFLDSYDSALKEGSMFKKSFELVAGDAVSRKLGLQIGDKITSSHGLATSDVNAHEEHPYTIVGLLKPTGTVVDQLLICNLESIWDAHVHVEDVNDTYQHKEAHEHGDDHNHEAHDHDEHQNHENNNREITSLLVKFKNPLGLVQLPRFINENSNLQTALPSFEMQRLTGLLGAGVKTINGIAIAILFVSGFSIFISLLKTIRERRHELALLRTYGLGTRKLLTLVLFEGIFLAFFGFLLGWLCGRLALIVASTYMESGYGYVLQINAPTQVEWQLLSAILGIAIVAVILASRPIFKMNISKILADA